MKSEDEWEMTGEGNSGKKEKRLRGTRCGISTVDREELLHAVGRE